MSGRGSRRQTIPPTRVGGVGGVGALVEDDDEEDQRMAREKEGVEEGAWMLV